MVASVPRPSDRPGPGPCYPAVRDAWSRRTRSARGASCASPLTWTAIVTAASGSARTRHALPRRCGRRRAAISAGRSRTCPASAPAPTARGTPVASSTTPAGRRSRTSAAQVSSAGSRRPRWSPSAAVEPAGAEDLGGASRLAERSGHAGAGVALADVEAGDAGRGRGGPEAGHLHHPDTGRATEGGAAVSASGSVTSVHRNSANAVPLRRAMISAISRYPAWPRWATRCPGTQPGSASVAQISAISGMSGISAGRPWS